LSYKYCFLNKNRYFKYMLSPKYDPSPKDHSKKSRKSRNDFILLTVNKQLNFVKKKKKIIVWRQSTSFWLSLDAFLGQQFVDSLIFSIITVNNFSRTHHVKKFFSSLNHAHEQSYCSCSINEKGKNALLSLITNLHKTFVAIMAFYLFFFLYDLTFFYHYCCISST